MQDLKDIQAHLAHSDVEQTPMFQLKGGLFPLSSLQLLGTNLDLLAIQLDAKVAQAPKFFYQAPIVIDLQKIKAPDIVIDFRQLKQILLFRKLIPVGIRGGHPALQKEAIQAGLAVLPEAKRDDLSSKEDKAGTEGKENKNVSQQDGQKDAFSIDKTSNDKTNDASSMASSNDDDNDDNKGTPTKVITTPVRSGQQIYVRGGDLIVLAPVSQGAELLADGHIHVYGPLRGRALAGVTGDTSAHIFCHSLEAELISIAGQYKISEDIDPKAWRLSVDISLASNRLHIRPF